MSVEHEGQGFKVRDRRLFTPEGELKEELKGGDEAPSSQTAQDRKKQAQQEASTQAGRTREVPLPKPTFSGFLTSFFLPQVLTFLGEIPHPETQKKEQNLPMAKYLIDVLGIIQEKTKGNLTPEEKTHLDNLLTDLRLLYVKAVKL